MNVQQFGIVLRMQAGSVTNKAVLLAMAWHARDDGRRCFASVRTLAAEADCNERTVRRALDAMEDAGIIYRHEDSGRQCWGIRMDTESALPDSPPAEVDSLSDPPVDSLSGEADSESAKVDSPPAPSEQAGTSRTSLVDDAIGIITDRKLEAQERIGRAIGDRDAYRRAIAKAVREDHAPALHRLSHDHPELAAAELANSVLPAVAAPTPIDPVARARQHGSSVSLLARPDAQDASERWKEPDELAAFWQGWEAGQLRPQREGVA